MSDALAHERRAEREERALLTLIFLRPSLYRQAIGLVAPEHFLSDRLGTIYRAMGEVDADGTEPHAAAVFRRLLDQDEVTRAGGQEFYADLVSESGVPVSEETAAWLCRTIRRAAALRQLDRQREALFDGDAPEIAERMKVALSQLEGEMRAVSSSLRDVHDTASMHARFLAAREQEREMLTGWRAIDRNGGLLPGELVTLIARPKVGKSAWAQNLALNVLNRDDNAGVWYFSLEMPEAQWWERWCQMCLSMSRDEVRAEREKWARTNGGQMGEVFRGLRVATPPTPTVLQIHGTLLEGRRKGARVDLAIVDYTDRMKLDGTPRDSQADRIRWTFNALKSMALDLDVPVVVLHQALREDQTDETKPPKARSSSGPEEASDLLLGAWRDGQDERKFMLQALFARRAPTYLATLEFNGETLQMTDPDIAQYEARP